MHMAAEAHRQHMLVWAHSAVFPTRPADVIAAGVDAVSHVCYLAYQAEPVMLASYEDHTPVNEKLLAQNGEVRERRNQLRHGKYAVPELLATGPNQLWSWDITKLLGPAKWTYYCLYVVMDVYSRKVVGWMVAHGESATLAQKLIKTSCIREGIQPGQLTIHADRGSSMTSKPVACRQIPR